MAVTYQKFLRSRMELSALGVDRRGEAVNYFCTPLGASHIGATGVDGIHFCFVRGYGEAVFAVSPENLPGEYVHPIASNFEDFLRLLLAVGDVAALEQAWSWDEATFDRFLTENPPSEEQKAALQQIRETFALAPMEAPFAYLSHLRATLDLSRIRYSREYHEITDAQRMSEDNTWRVFYNGGFAMSAGDHSRPGREVRVDRSFVWGGETWHIPAIYICTKGLVIDYCIETREEIHADSTVFCNGCAMPHKSGTFLYYLPAIETMGEAQDPNAVRVLSYYGLDEDKPWIVLRASYPWTTRTKPKELRTLSVRLAREPETVTGVTVRDPMVGADIALVHPVTDTKHTLHIVSCESQRLQSQNHDGFAFPGHCVTLSYTLTPPLSSKSFSVRDASSGDRPRRVGKPQSRSSNDDFVSSVAVCIGEPAGPTAVMGVTTGAPDVRSAVSSLYFSPPEHIAWQTVFRIKRMADTEITIFA